MKTNFNIVIICSGSKATVMYGLEDVNVELSVHVSNTKRRLIEAYGWIRKNTLYIKNRQERKTRAKI